MRTRAIAYQAILSDAANLSYFAGKLLLQAQHQLLQCTSKQDHDMITDQCNVAVLKTYIYNLKMLYPGLRIVCQDAELPKQQIALINKLDPQTLPVRPDELREMRRSLPVSASMHRLKAKERYL